MKHARRGLSLTLPMKYSLFRKGPNGELLACLFGAAAYSKDPDWFSEGGYVPFPILSEPYPYKPSVSYREAIESANDYLNLSVPEGSDFREILLKEIGANRDIYPFAHRRH